MCREMALIPQLSLPLCDVRDVALAHVRSLQFYEVVGKRHLLVSTREPHNLKQYALWLKEEFGSKGYSISTREAPNFLLKLVGMVNKTVAFVVPMLGKVPNFDNARFVDVLKIQPIDPRKTMIDMTYSMIERGFIPKKF
jgi:nucleoside-diphosphate-sugar epimerase